MQLYNTSYNVKNYWENSKGILDDYFIEGVVSLERLSCKYEID